MKFERGGKIQFKGKDSVFRGYFLCYVDKLPWYDPPVDEEHEEATRCLVQLPNTGMVFIKPEPTEKNRGWE